MNYLVFLDPHAGELEKILSGMKTMLVKELDPALEPGSTVQPGDSLYFLRGMDDCAVRVKATVVRILSFSGQLEEPLKELQPRLQLTEDQYNHWSAKKQLLLVEFGFAQKIGVIQVSPDQLTGRPGWIPFTEFSLIT